jgi:hypothetical protein
MNRERELVVKPLVRWFRDRPAQWKLHTPQYATSERGWDITAHRKNQALLIEAKYIKGPFLASLSGLVTAPLANRPDQNLKRKYRSWSYGVCWAIGSYFPLKNMYQILFDYVCRNPIFWRHYVHDLHMKYIFFIDNHKQVARISFTKFLEISNEYSVKVKASNALLAEKRAIAEELLGKKLKFTPTWRAGAWQGALRSRIDSPGHPSYR